MHSEQQKETLDYFETNAKAWQALAADKSQETVNTLQQRYRYGWHVAEKHGPFRRIIDAGCGAGDALWPLAEKGAQCFGLDFAPTMIELAQDTAKSNGYTKCKFQVGDVLSFDYPSASFDLAVSYGLIEYFSRAETEIFLEKMHDTLAPGGAIVVESRNRLFNLVTMNDYTRLEIDTANLEILAREAIACVNAADMNACVAAIMSAPAPKPLDGYPLVGVPVKLRHQYTPGEMCRMLASAGFEPRAVSGYHYHGVVPKWKDAMPSFHAKISNAAQDLIVERPEALVHSSSFMVYAVRH